MAKQPGAKVVAIEQLEGLLGELPATAGWIARRVREAVELLQQSDEVALRERCVILEAELEGREAELADARRAAEMAIAYLQGMNAQATPARAAS